MDGIELMSSMWRGIANHLLIALGLIAVCSAAVFVAWLMRWQGVEEDDIPPEARGDYYDGEDW